eukprot:2006887-Pyramimonas_sp.AAC.1
MLWRGLTVEAALKHHVLLVKGVQIRPPLHRLVCSRLCARDTLCIDGMGWYTGCDGIRGVM